MLMGIFNNPFIIENKTCFVEVGLIYLMYLIYLIPKFEMVLVNYSA